MGTVPQEIFAGRGIDKLAPTIVNVNLEVFILNLI